MKRSTLPLLISAFGLFSQANAKVWISEFVADNDGSHLDENNDAEDWIELFNDGAQAVDLGGWSLTDNSADLQQWIFPPGTSIEANGYLVVFASKKNRRVPGFEYHTNFSLSKGGEYLGLIQADGVTVEDDFEAEFPGQFEGASYGIGQGGGVRIIVPAGAPGRAGVPTDAADFANNYSLWNAQSTQAFDGPSWRTVNSGVGFDTGIGFGDWIGEGGDFRTEMHGINASVFLRLPFNLEVATVNDLALKMRWDDGFIAYINGVQVAEDREDPAPAWDSDAEGSRSDSENDDWNYFNIDTANLNLVAGENILAIHGMNSSRGSSDMVILPELEGVIAGAVSTVRGYHTTITPGAPNGDSLATVPPIIREVTEKPDRPVGGAGSAPILITAEIQPGSRNVTQVRLFHRSMFGNETQLSMTDDGAGADVTAGDGIYSITIPTTQLDVGEMLRWRVEASDIDGGKSLSPPYLDPLDADRYFGTVALNPAHDSSQLTILETFVQNQTAVDTVAGTRASVFYLGEFYDNLQMDRHGQSTGAFPKKSYDVDFNKGNRFRWHADEERVKDINLLTNWADKSKVRNTMGYEFLRRTGSPSHYAFAVRVQRNGEFFSIADMVEDGDDRFLDRAGLDREGTLYKMYNRLDSITGASKKTRKEEPSDDIAALIAGLNTANSQTSRRRFAYDNVNLAATVNHLAAYVVIGISDTGHKNYYMYRDTMGDEEWQPLPWDIDLSAGRRWNSTDKYFDDTFFDNLWIRNANNRLWTLIHDTPEYRLMILRRIRTLRENLLLSNSDAANGVDWYTDMINDLRDKIDPIGIESDADLDYAKWGSWGNNNRVRPAAERIVSEWLPDKRNYIFSSARTQGGVSIPSAQPAVPDLEISEVEFLPSSGIQGEEYLVIKNGENSAMDISEFTLSGAIDYTFPAGTVVNSGNGNSASQYQGVIHLTKEAKAFRARTSGPTGDEYRYIQGGYSGQLSARGETIELRSPTGDLVDTFTYPGTPTPAQRGLRVSEINYHPTDPTAAELAALPGVTSEDFEFIELLNTGTIPVNLNNAQITEGIALTFPDGLILYQDQRLLVVKNPAAFAIRYPGLSTPIVGPYAGQLNNDGDTIRVIDGLGENVVVFTYNDSWYPSTDGNGKTITIADSETPYDAFNDPGSWAASLSAGGSPGQDDVLITTDYSDWQEENFAPALWDTTGASSADPDGDGRPNWLEYAFTTNPMVVDDELFQTEIITDGEQQYLGARVQRRANTSDLTWSLETGDDLSGWTTNTPAEVTLTPQDNGSEMAILREASPAGASQKKFLRIRVTFDQ